MPRSMARSVFRRHHVTSKKRVVKGITVKPVRLAIAPVIPRNREPTQTATPTMLGPGKNWQRLSISAKSWSSIQHLCSTTRRREKTMPPPPPILKNPTFRNPLNSAGNEATSQFAIHAASYCSYSVCIFLLLGIGSLLLRQVQVELCLTP